MRIVRFELTMPNVGSWNGVDTGAKNGCYIFRRLKKEQYEDIVDKGFYYNFGDGWGANVIVTLNRRSATSGFRGYDWMVDEIIEHGRILTREERHELRDAVQ